MGLKEARETVRACRYCFMCRYACPTFLATKLESVTPHGYGILLTEVDTGCREWSEEIVEKFYHCTLCGLGKADCEFNWPEDEMVRHGREEIVKKAKQPERVKKIASSIMDCGNPFTETLEWNLSSGLIHKKNPKVLYYVGSATRRNHPEIVEAVAQVLNAAGTDLGVLREEGPSGNELFELGYSDEAKAAAGRLADNITRAAPQVLLVSCPHTYRTFKEFYPLWGVDLPADMRIVHTSEYFTELLNEGKIKMKHTSHQKKVSYHDPCQLGRKMSVYDAPRFLIKAAQGTAPVELFHNKEHAECCGAGATMLLTDPKVSLKVAKVRMERVLETDTEVLVTACPNCKTVLTLAKENDNINLKIFDIAEFLVSNL